MFKCKYAHDASDEYCKDCDGITILDGDTEASAETCPGYEKGEEIKAEEPVEEEPKVEEAPVAEKEPEPVVEEKPKKEEKKPTATKKEKKEEIKKEVVEESKCCCESQTVEVSSKTVEIRCDSGVSFEAKPNLWYKVAYGETRTVSASNVEEERKKLWDDVNREVDSQIAEIQETLNNK
jgi:hypothetical protein